MSYIVASLPPVKCFVRKEFLCNLSEYGHRLGALMFPHLGLKDHIVAEVTDLIRR